MIGWPSFFLELFFVCIPALILLCLYYDKKSNRLKNKIGLVFLTIFVLVTGNRFVHQLWFRTTLQWLTPQQVSLITINNHQISSPEIITKITNDLNQIQWFSADHGGWSQMAPMTITMKNGKIYYFYLAKYKREPGIVIQFSKSTNLATFYYGYAFHAHLPETLTQAGINLP